MTDFHSHILPGMDDGSKNAEESVKMLEVSASQGIKAIVATPHFYPTDESPKDFLARREAAIDRLSPLLMGRDDLPEIYVGAEVAYYRGLGKSEFASSLAIEGTNIILVEMPAYEWNDFVVDDLISLAKEQALRPVIAHLERYISFQSKQTVDKLIYNEVLFQANASFFDGGFFTKRKAIKMVETGRISLLGSDCHNLDTRAPGLTKATDLIKEKLGEDYVRRLSMNAKMLLHNAKPILKNLV